MNQSDKVRKDDSRIEGAASSLLLRNYCIETALYIYVTDGIISSLFESNIDYV